jgi:hypothetical protein
VWIGTYRRFGKRIGFIFKGQPLKEENSLTVEDGTGKLSGAIVNYQSKMYNVSEDRYYLFSSKKLGRAV